jgi:hypothetical protein
MRGNSRRAELDLSASHDPDGRIDITSEEALDRVERQRLRRVLAGALAGLRPRDRRVFVLQNVMGLSHEEIARDHEMSVHAVRNLAWRARRALRSSLGSERVRNWGWLVALRFPAARRRAGAGSGNGPPQGMVLERVAAIVVGIAAAATATAFGGDPSGEKDPVTVVAEPAGGAAVGRIEADRRTRSDPGGEREQTVAHFAPSSVVTGAVAVAPKRNRAAAPSGATAYLEVRTKNGGTLVYHEHAASCGGQGEQVLPPDGPVALVC